jgi:hypothetical protein
MSKAGAKRMSLRDEEFRVLRETIAARGTVRIVLLAVSLLGWALLAAGLVVFSEWPISALISLGVLVAGFEAIHALHVGVERIGRYIQVFYESGPEGPQWESTAMRLGPGLPGGGVDPLFTAVFLGATFVNLLVVFIPPPSAAEAVAPLLFHLLFVTRVVRARRAAAQQRAKDLATYTTLRDSMLRPGPGPSSH